MVYSVIIALLVIILISRIGILVNVNDKGIEIFLLLFGIIKVHINRNNKTRGKPKQHNKNSSIKKALLKVSKDNVKAALSHINADISINGRLGFKNAENTALSYGLLNSIVGILIPIIKRHLNIFNCSMNLKPDFKETVLSYDIRFKLSIKVLWLMVFTFKTAIEAHKYNKKFKSRLVN